MLTSERLSRDAMAAFLWPEVDDKRGKAALRRNLADVLHQMGEEATAQEQIKQSVTT